MRLAVAIACGIAWITACSSAPAADETAREIFTHRILPLAKADKPSSCAECHAAGVDLGQYIKDDAAATFIALRSAAW